MRFEPRSGAASTLFEINREINSRSVDFVAIRCQSSKISRKDKTSGDPECRVKVKISLQLRKSVKNHFQASDCKQL